MIYELQDSSQQFFAEAKKVELEKLCVLKSLIICKKLFKVLIKSFKSIPIKNLKNYSPTIKTKWACIFQGIFDFYFFIF